MSSPFLIGVQGQNGSINLIPIKPPTFWQRLEKWIAWLVAWGLWTLLAFFVGYAVGAL